jgi:tetratricopeptide (TPR) repeat protein
MRSSPAGRGIESSKLAPANSKREAIYREPIAGFDKAAMLQSPTADVYYWMGVTLRKVNHGDEAVAALRKAVELDPSHVQAHVELCDILISQHKIDETEKLIDSFPSAASQPTVGTAAMFRSLGDFYAVKAEWRKAVDRLPT